MIYSTISKKSCNEEILNITENAILIIYALFITEDFLKATTFRICWPKHFHEILVIITIVLLITKFLLFTSYKIGDVFVISIFATVFLMAGMISEYVLLYEVLLFILIMKDVPFRKILQVYFITIIFLLVITIISSQVGVIDNLIYYAEDRGYRQSFGVCYPTDFSAFFVWLSFVWICLRERKLSYLELFMICIAGIGVWHYCGARLSMGILLLTAIVFFMIKVKQTDFKFKENRNQQSRNKIRLNRMNTIVAFAIPICAVIVILLSYFYSKDSEWMLKLDFILNSRLSLGHMAFVQYDVSLFGQFIPLVGNGGSSAFWLRTNYFFIDSSFLSILLCYGFFVFLCVLFIFTYSAFRAKNQNEYLIWIIALIAVACIVEHHMMELRYDPFLLMLLAKHEVIS